MWVFLNRIFIGLVLLFVQNLLSAQVPVRVDAPARLFAQPSETSFVTTEVGGGSRFRALEQSPDKQWVFVSDGMRYGWIRKIFLRVEDAASAAIADMATPMGLMPKESVVSNFSNDDLPLPEEKDLPASSYDDFDDNFEGESAGVYLITRPGTFFEKPERESARYGQLQANDSAILLEDSQDKRWARVRLQDTGEEGWVPRVRMGRRVSSAELRSMENFSGKKTHIGFYGAYVPQPWNMGFFGVIRRSFESLTIGDTPVELGVGAGFNMGMEERVFGQPLSVSYVDLRVMAHWEPLLSKQSALPLEVGVVMKYATIETAMTEQQFKQYKGKIRDSEAGLFFGIGYAYYLAPSFKVDFSPQIQLTSSVDILANLGLVFSF
jgi:hypothetical protein